MTEAEYLAIERAAERKSEFFAGEMFAMAGVSRAHNLIVTNLIAELRDQLRKRECEVYPSEMKVRVLKGGMFAYPDVVVVCGEPQLLDSHGDVLLNPTLVVEVLSPSTAAYDRGVKAFYYRRLPSLREYVLIEQDRLLVELYQRTNDTARKWTVEASDNLADTIKLNSIGCELTLASIYEKVALDPTVPPAQDGLL